MRTVFVTLLSIMMLWSQANTASSAPPAPTVCNHCDCGQVNCCIEKSGQPRPPVPAASLTVSYSSFDLLNPVLPASRAPAPTFSASAAPSPGLHLARTGLALYQRDCALLL